MPTKTSKQPSKQTKPKSQQPSNRCTPKERQLNGKNLEDLRSLARSNGLKGYRRMNKPELLSFLCSKLTMTQIKGGGRVEVLDEIMDTVNAKYATLYGTLNGEGGCLNKGIKGDNKLNEVEKINQVEEINKFFFNTDIANKVYLSILDKLEGGVITTEPGGIYRDVLERLPKGGDITSYIGDHFSIKYLEELNGGLGEKLKELKEKLKELEEKLKELEEELDSTKFTRVGEYKKQISYIETCKKKISYIETCKKKIEGVLKTLKQNKTETQNY